MILDRMSLLTLFVIEVEMRAQGILSKQWKLWKVSPGNIETSTFHQ